MKTETRWLVIDVQTQSWGSRGPTCYVEVPINCLASKFKSQSFVPAKVAHWMIQDNIPLAEVLNEKGKKHLESVKPDVGFIPYCQRKTMMLGSVYGIYKTKQAMMEDRFPTMYSYQPEEVS